jgi:hypothetical protein
MEQKPSWWGGGLAKGNMRSMKDDLLRSIQQGFLKFAAERIHRARLAAAAALALLPQLKTLPRRIWHLNLYSTTILEFWLPLWA